MQKFDILIIGGGMVGLTLALALRHQNQQSQSEPLSIAIVDNNEPSALSEQPELRVSAINLASQQIFANLGVWAAIKNQRLQAYQHMHIWDKHGYGQLNFANTDVNEKDLGWIIENKVIRNALWQKAQTDDGIHFFTEQALTNVTMGDNEVFASFADGAPILAKLVVGADGAHSWLRKQMNMPIMFQDYDHHALVATIECEQGHNNTAWQVFLPEGPLAFLPLFESNIEGCYEKNQCSIVWSTTPDEAQRLQALSSAEFSKEITATSDGKLGNITLQSERVSFPLTMRLAHDFVKDKAILVGDAAHTIHPLAGQGVNLGLLDAASLAETLLKQLEQNKPLTSSIALNEYSRWRKSEATEMIAAMAAIKNIFSEQPFKLPSTPVKLIRGLGLSLIDNFSPVKHLMIKQALGFKTHLPELAKALDPLEN
ncbi:MAG: FAD-dependent monooxygenase [Alteromonadaceae bacterium]|nr:FAD-dependent monooxygenase [Alteromonadaceae bacterium]